MNFVNSHLVCNILFGMANLQINFQKERTEAIKTVLSSVAEETGIEMESILSNDRHREVVDARHIAIKMLHDNGFYPSEIASTFSITVRNVMYIISRFELRTLSSKPVMRAVKRMRKKFGTNKETDGK